jgi:hypothetical protein
MDKPDILFTCFMCMMVYLCITTSSARGAGDAREGGAREGGAREGTLLQVATQIDRLSSQLDRIEHQNDEQNALLTHLTVRLDDLQLRREDDDALSEYQVIPSDPDSGPCRDPGA